jgi:hypothetical protein
VAQAIAGRLKRAVPPLGEIARVSVQHRGARARDLTAGRSASWPYAVSGTRA